MVQTRSSMQLSSKPRLLVSLPVLLWCETLDLTNLMLLACVWHGAPTMFS